MAKKGISIEIDDKAVNQLLNRAMKAAPVEATKAVTDCVLDLAGESSRRAPIESGDLRNNCHGQVNGATVFQEQQAAPAGTIPTANPEGSVGYSLPYALRQHEDLTLRHDRTDGHYRPDGSSVNLVAGGEAKYLEKPFLERKGRYISRFEQALRKVLK